MSKLIGLAALTLILVSGCANNGEAHVRALALRNKQRIAIVWGRYLPPLVSELRDIPQAPCEIYFNLSRRFPTPNNRVHAIGQFVLGKRIIGDYHVEFAYGPNDLEPIGFAEAIRLNFKVITAKEKEDIRQWLERRYQKDVKFEIDGKPNHLWEYEVTMAQDRYPSLHAGVYDSFWTKDYPTYIATGEELERVLRTKVLPSDSPILWEPHGYRSVYQHRERGIDRTQGVVLHDQMVVATIQEGGGSMDGTWRGAVIQRNWIDGKDFQWPKTWVGPGSARNLNLGEEVKVLNKLSKKVDPNPDSISLSYRVSEFPAAKKP